MCCALGSERRPLPGVPGARPQHPSSRGPYRHRVAGSARARHGAAECAAGWALSAVRCRASRVPVRIAAFPVRSALPPRGAVRPAQSRYRAVARAGAGAPSARRCRWAGVLVRSTVVPGVVPPPRGRGRPDRHRAVALAARRARVSAGNAPVARTHPPGPAAGRSSPGRTAASRPGQAGTCLRTRGPGPASSGRPPAGPAASVRAAAGRRIAGVGGSARRGRRRRRGAPAAAHAVRAASTAAPGPFGSSSRLPPAGRASLPGRPEEARPLPVTVTVRPRPVPHRQPQEPPVTWSWAGVRVASVTSGARIPWPGRGRGEGRGSRVWPGGLLLRKIPRSKAGASRSAARVIREAAAR